MVDRNALLTALEKESEGGWPALKEKLLPEAIQPNAPPEVIVAAFNKLLEGETLSGLAVDFENRPMPLELKQLGASQPTGDRLALYHRKLIDRVTSDYVKPIGHDFEIVCAELCGWGHYKMKGRLIVHDTPEQWAEWMEQATAAEEVTK